jgi:ATP-dependent Clp protease adaptor protein ClpS
MSDTKTKDKTDVRPRITVKTDLTPPRKYHVIYMNDNTTTMEFVIESLKTVFDHDQQSAEELTMRIHEDGSAVVATLPYEIAEEKGVEATLLARNHGFPLQIKIEQE